MIMSSRWYIISLEFGKVMWTGDFFLGISLWLDEITKDVNEEIDVRKSKDGVLGHTDIKRSGGRRIN
jgi:hypothetical protein